jgi:hypothetical protein
MPVVDGPSVVSGPPIGITPRQLLTMFFMTEKRVGIVMPDDFQLRLGESGHADLDAAVAPMFLDQNGRLQARAVARIDPSEKKCDAVVDASLEVFDRTNGDTVAVTGDVTVKPL